MHLVGMARKFITRLKLRTCSESHNPTTRSLSSSRDVLDPSKYLFLLGLPMLWSLIGIDYKLAVDLSSGNVSKLRLRVLRKHLVIQRSPICPHLTPRWLWIDSWKLKEFALNSSLVWSRRSAKQILHR